MLKFCINCGKEFEGTGDVCQECLTIPPLEKPSPVGTLLTRFKEKATPKTIIICAASLIGIIAIIIVISVIAGNSQSAYNKHAYRIYLEASSSSPSDAQGLLSINSDGNIIYGENATEQLTVKKEWKDEPDTIQNANNDSFLERSTSDLSYVNGIKTKYPKAEKLKWMICFEDDGSIGAVYCSDTYNSTKIGVYKNRENNYRVTTIDEFEKSQKEIQEKAIKDYKDQLVKDAEINQNAEKIREYVMENYRPDGLDKLAVLSNLEHKNDIVTEISKIADGYWIVRYEVISTDSRKEGYCKVFWAKDKDSEILGSAGTWDDSFPISPTSGGIEQKLKDEENSQCTLISRESWDKKYSQEYDDVREVVNHSFGKKDDFIDRFNNKLSSLMGTELQFKSQANKENNSIRYDYTYLNGAVTLTILEKHGYIVMANTSTNISLATALKANNTQLWTGIVNSCYFPLAVLENYSDKDEVIKTFLANYIDTNDVITINGSSYSATLYNTTDGTLVSFLPN